MRGGGGTGTAAPSGNKDTPLECYFTGQAFCVPLGTLKGGWVGTPGGRGRCASCSGPCLCLHNDFLGRRADGVWEAPSTLVWEAGGPPGARGAQCSTYKEACWPALAKAEEADE